MKIFEMLLRAMTFVSIYKFLKLDEDGHSCSKYTCNLASGVTMDLIENKSF